MTSHFNFRCLSCNERFPTQKSLNEHTSTCEKSQLPRKKSQHLPASVNVDGLEHIDGDLGESRRTTLEIKHHLESLRPDFPYEKGRKKAPGTGFYWKCKYPGCTSKSEFTSATKMFRHMKTHFGSVCPNCIERFPNEETLMLHQRKEKCKKPEYKCPHCKNDFSKKEALDRHVRQEVCVLPGEGRTVTFDFPFCNQTPSNPERAMHQHFGDRGGTGFTWTAESGSSKQNKPKHPKQALSSDSESESSSSHRSPNSATNFSDLFQPEARERSQPHDHLCLGVLGRGSSYWRHRDHAGRVSSLMVSALA
ncbi:hypothetical protein T439DRAFT_33169 [Meredithblackwellia eburnea MCA 4105]